MKLTDQQCDAVLLGACGASGIGYWLATRAAPGTCATGFVLTVEDGTVRRMTRATVRKGVARLIDGWLDGSLALPYGCDRGGVDGWDGPACDVVIQLGLFGEIVYG